MDNLEKPARASWFRLRHRIYVIKERPKSWANGNYRKLILNDDVTSQHTAARQSMPPIPPARSPLTRLQTVPSVPREEPQTIDNILESILAEAQLKATERNNEIATAKNEANSNHGTENSPKQEKEFTLMI